MLGPGWCDVEQLEDAALGVGEAVELDAGAGVGEAESLEDAERVASGGYRGAVLGQEAGNQFVLGERFAELGLDQSEDQQRDADDAGERVDAVVVVQEDRADLERLLVVAVAALDDLLAFVGAQHLPGGQALAGKVGRQRVDPVGLGGGGDRVLVALPGDRRLPLAGAGGDGDQVLDLAGEDPGDSGVDLFAGLVVAAAEPVAHALSCSSAFFSARSRAAATSDCSWEEWM